MGIKALIKIAEGAKGLSDSISWQLGLERLNDTLPQCQKYIKN